MAKIKGDINNIISTENNYEINEIMKGDSIIFNKRKEKAKNILNEINAININDINRHEEIKNKIGQALSYDNTNKEIIYKCLKYYEKMKFENEFNDLVIKAKYSLTQKFDLNTKNIDMNKEFKLPIDTFLFENEAVIITKLKIS